MPTIADNLRYYLRHYVSPHRATIAHLARAIGVIFAITLALEVFVFNFNYFVTMDYDTISLKREIHLKQDANDVFRMTEADHTLEFSNLNTKVNNSRRRTSRSRYDSPMTRICAISIPPSTP